ncbi:MAG: AAA family ATPase, partial [Actinomycetota bacterium]|nr:AAA family ATPase [Actinomycetota bacterium]
DDAVVARSAGHAADAVTHLRRAHHGRAVVLPSRPADEAAAVAPAPPAGTRPVAELLAARDRDSVGVLAALRHALAGTFIVVDWPQAVALHDEHPDLTFVTPDGDVAGPCGFVGGSTPDRSSMVSAAAAEEAERRVAELDDAVTAAASEVGRARARVDERRAELATATAALNGSDARITAAAEQLARLTKDLDALTHQEGLLRQHRAELTASVQRHQQALVTLETEELVAPPASDDPDPTERDAEADRLDRRVDECRSRELQARLAVERLDEQVQQLRRAAAELREEADHVEQALAEAARRRDLRRRHVRRCGDLAAVAAEALTNIDGSIRDACADRDRLDADRAQREQQVAALRRRLREQATALDAARERRHAADLQRAEVRHRLDQLIAQVRDDFQLTPDDLLAEHPDAATDDRADLVARLETLERKVASLGRVNPLALEEFHALEERHGFLSRQLNDLLASRRDLHQVIRAVDAKIRDVFADAFRDVSREFEDVFATIFPGGHGRLTLTDPDDLLTTGIEVEARPPGKRIRRLSLLSGGERSLAALAFLFAIFRARPSPFYVLDEVEAALDEVNLRRFLQVVESFKQTSQVLLVTHQTPTMEIADMLYGVTMGADAVSKVVAERLSEDVPA